MLGFAGSAPTYKLRRLWLSVAKPNVYREISFSFPSSPTLLLFFNKREKGVMPLPLSDYASLIEPAWLAIILPVLLYPLSPWERVRVRGGSHVGLRRLSTNLPIVQVVAERISYVGLRRLSTNLQVV